MPIRGIVLWFLVLVSFVYLSTVIHEYSHKLAAMILSVDSADIHIVFSSIRPHIIIPEGALSEPHLQLYHYAGGLTAGTIFTITYITTLMLWWRRYNYNPFHLSSWVGFIILLIAVIELYNGYWEGSNFEIYIKNEHMKSWNLLSLPLIVPSIHFLATPRRKQFVNVINKRFRTKSS